MSALSLYGIVWLIADYRAIGRMPIELAGDELRLRVGRRFVARVPLANVAAVREPSWRTLPERQPAYLRASGFADPNVVIAFRAPVRFALGGGLSRHAREIGLRLERPGAFVSAVQKRAGVTPTA